MDELLSKVDISRRRFVQQLAVGVFTSATLLSFPRVARAQVSLVPTPTPSGSFGPVPTPPPSPPLSPPPLLAQAQTNDDTPKPPRQKKKRTNRVGDRDYETSGIVVGIRLDLASPVPGIVADMPQLPFNVDDVPYILIATSDGIQQIRLGGLSSQKWAGFVLGRWTELGGEKVHEQLFDATEVFEL